MKKILIGLLTLTMLVGCRKDEPENESPTAERTVLIYMAAQNNLTYNIGNRFADADLKEIKSGVTNLGDNHLVVYVSKATDPVADNNDSKPYLLHYRKGELRDSIPMESTQLASDPTTLKTVAQKAFTDFPAKDYGLILWGHASGWLFNNDSIAGSAVRHRAYGGSNKNGSYQGSGDMWMNIPTMARVLKTLPHLRFIFADCCNMMCAECAYELKDVTDYFIASPAEIPGAGAPYDLIVPAMMEKESFWTSICDNYAAKYPKHLPLAVVKSSEMASLAAATKTVLQSMKAADNLSQFPNLSGLIYYLKYNLYDINHFIKTYATEAEYASWKQALDKAVVYKIFSTRWDTNNFVTFMDFYGNMNEENYGGMSMFIPQWRLQSSDNQYIKKMGWYYAAGYDSVGW